MIQSFTTISLNPPLRPLDNDKGEPPSSEKALMYCMMLIARNFEAFKYLHIGCVSELKRKSLPEIAKSVGLDNYQGLHHSLGFAKLQSIVYRFTYPTFIFLSQPDFYFSSA